MRLTDKTPGELVKIHRVLAKFNQTELAKHLGVSQSTVSTIETDESPIQADLIIKICQTLDIPLKELLGAMARHNQVIPISLQNRSAEARRRIGELVAQLYEEGETAA